jgi:integrase
LKYRIFSQQRWFTIGRHGSPWTPDMARKEAMRLLGSVANGVDPAQNRAEDRKALSVSELCDVYLAEGASHKKPSTLKADRARIAHHIKPILGSKRVDQVGRGDVERLMVDVQDGRTAKSTPRGPRQPGSVLRGGKGVASQCVALVSTVLNFAVARGLRPDNPARGIKKPPTRKVERFLSSDEIASLATTIEAEKQRTSNPYPGAAIKLLLLTGARRNEIMQVQWRHVDFERHCLRLPDSKTGPKVIYLSPPALDILSNLPRLSCNPFVIPGMRDGCALIGIDKVWFRVRRAAGLDDVRLHDLRHSFASIGAGGGLSLPVIGALLGHKHAATTAR